MERSSSEYQDCIQILKEELRPAMGCTEPIAVAYCAAIARQTLGVRPERVRIEASGNIIKNVESVVVPNTGHLRGIPAAAAIGIVAGRAGRELQVIAEVTEEQKQETAAFLASAKIEVVLAETPLIFDIIITVYAGSDRAKVRIANYHTNVVLIEKNGEVLLQRELETNTESGLTDRGFLSMELIYDFANSFAIEDLKETLDRQISYNMAIAAEGLRGNYGANVGSVLQYANGTGLKAKCVAMAAAGSDARMNGCELPVVINSGSGNQGMAVSIPVVVYARETGASEEKLYRALALSNLAAIHQKTGIGRLSAFCGAVNAGTAAGCGIAYLADGSLDAVTNTLVNALAITSGMICDGAKASCAGKIAVAVETGFLGYEMYTRQQRFRDGEGIVRNGVESTIRNVGRLGREGMRQTDVEILHIMIEN